MTAKEASRKCSARQQTIDVGVSTEKAESKSMALASREIQYALKVSEILSSAFRTVMSMPFCTLIATQSLMGKVIS